MAKTNDTFKQFATLVFQQRKSFIVIAQRLTQQSQRQLNSVNRKVTLRYSCDGDNTFDLIDHACTCWSTGRKFPANSQMLMALRYPKIASAELSSLCLRVFFTIFEKATHCTVSGKDICMILIAMIDLFSRFTQTFLVIL